MVAFPRRRQRAAGPPPIAAILECYSVGVVLGFVGFGPPTALSRRFQTFFHILTKISGSEVCAALPE